MRAAFSPARSADARTSPRAGSSADQSSGAHVPSPRRCNLRRQHERNTGLWARCGGLCLSRARPCRRTLVSARHTRNTSNLAHPAARPPIRLPNRLSVLSVSLKTSFPQLPPGSHQILRRLPKKSVCPAGCHQTSSGSARPGARTALPHVQFESGTWTGNVRLHRRCNGDRERRGRDVRPRKTESGVVRRRSWGGRCGLDGPASHRSGTRVLQRPPPVGRLHVHGTQPAW